MTVTRRAYGGDDDFVRIRGFLIRTFALYQLAGATEHRSPRPTAPRVSQS